MRLWVGLLNIHWLSFCSVENLRLGRLQVNPLSVRRIVHRRLWAWLLLVLWRSWASLLIMRLWSVMLCLGGLCPPPALPRSRWGGLQRGGGEATLPGNVTRAGSFASGSYARA